jgi:hypothetical protein
VNKLEHTPPDNTPHIRGTSLNVMLPSKQHLWSQSNHPGFVKLAAMAFAHAVLLASAMWCNSVQLVGIS